MKKTILLAVLGLFLCVGQAFAGLYSVTVSQDAFGNPGNPPGYTPAPVNNTDLQTGGSLASLNYSVLLQFNLSGITENITSVSLNLYKKNGSGSSGTTAFNAADAWTETSDYTTFQTIVTGATTSIGSSSVTGAASNGWVTWNLTGLTSAMYSDGILSIALKEDTLGGFHLFDSRTGTAGNAPYLSVSTAAVPIPGAVWLLGSGLLGLVAIRRRFKK